MREREEQTLPVAALALTGYGAYRAAFPTETLAWDQLPDTDRDLWLSAAAIVASMPPDIDGISWQDAARVVFVGATDGDLKRAWNDQTWRLLLHGERVAREAALRHMVILVDSGTPEDFDLEALEQSWRAWAQRQRSPETPVVESVA